MKLPSVARCRLDQRRFVAQAVMQPRGDVEPRLDCRLRIGDQFGPELAAGVGDAEDERPGTRSNGLGEAPARHAEGERKSVGSGTRGTVRVDLGGRRISKQKKN